MTEPAATGPTVRELLILLIEDSTAAAERLECVALRGTTMDRETIVRRVLESQKEHLRSAVRAAKLLEYTRRIASAQVTRGGNDVKE